MSVVAARSCDYQGVSCDLVPLSCDFDPLSSIDLADLVDLDGMCYNTNNAKLRDCSANIVTPQSFQGVGFRHDIPAPAVDQDLLPVWAWLADSECYPLAQIYYSQV